MISEVQSIDAAWTIKEPHLPYKNRHVIDYLIYSKLLLDGTVDMLVIWKG